MNPLGHIAVAQMVSRDKRVLIGSLLPDVIMSVVKTKDFLFGRTEAPRTVIVGHRWMHSLAIAAVVYKISAPIGVGMLLHIAADFVTHDKPERSPLLWPLEKD